MAPLRTGDPLLELQATGQGAQLASLGAQPATARPIGEVLDLPRALHVRASSLSRVVVTRRTQLLNAFDLVLREAKLPTRHPQLDVSRSLPDDLALNRPTVLEVNQVCGSRPGNGERREEGER